MQILLALLAAAAAITLLVIVVVFIVAPVFRIIGMGFAHFFQFIGGLIGDSLRAVGALITMAVFVPFVILNIIIGRWSAAGHFGRSIQDECRAFGRSLYRVFLGHPARFLLLRPMLEGVENRVPQAMAKAPGSDRPSRKTGSFDGYKIIGSLPSGGSGARLYIAEPDERRLAAFARQGAPGIDRVIIKSFSLKDGSSLPQIIRESRALEAAKKIGLVLEHELTEQRFHYVMPYVPGESLGVVARKLHEESESGGLDDARLREAVGYVHDLLKTIAAYHRAGLWHKDIKPDNIIVSEGEAHLVDLGLVTPLRSAMTLTTHGTEYFRDPEMVRMALKGVKVHEVDGAKFDVYATGAVLYSLVENSFPAHGGMSLLNKRCPEAVRWVVRRSMAEYNQRYASSYEMYADLEAVLNAEDMYTLMPAELPSVKGGVDASAHDDPTPDEASRKIAAGAPVPPKATPAADQPRPMTPPPTPNVAAAPGERTKPRLSLVNWWTGSYTPGPSRPAPAAAPAKNNQGEADGWRPWREGSDEPLIDKSINRGPRDSAEAQLRRARQRADSARRRAQKARINAQRNRKRRDKFSKQLNPGVGVAMLVFVVAIAGAALALFSHEKRLSEMRRVEERNAYADSGQTLTPDALGLDEFSIFEDLKNLGGLKGMHTEIIDALADADIFDREQGVLRFEEDGAQITIKAPAWLLTTDNMIGNQSNDQPAPPTSPNVPLKGSVLVLDSLGDAADEQTRTWVSGRLGRLQSIGYKSVGLGGSEEDVDLTASALNEIKLGAADDPATIERLKGWLRDSENPLTGIIWISRDRPVERPLILMQSRQAERRVERLFRKSN